MNRQWSGEQKLKIVRCKKFSYQSIILPKVSSVVAAYVAVVVAAALITTKFAIEFFFALQII